VPAHNSAGNSFDFMFLSHQLVKKTFDAIRPDIDPRQSQANKPTTQPS
jgi:hypothetical protein